MPKAQQEKTDEAKAAAEQRAGFLTIARWDAYEAFRIRSIVFLCVYNILLLVANVTLAFGLEVGPILSVAAVIAGAAAASVAIRFVEDARRHFRQDRVVRTTIDQASERVGAPAAWASFVRTRDGQLVVLTVVQFVIMAVQFWQSLH